MVNQCGKSCWYLSKSKDGEYLWTVIVCPYPPNHAGMHGDVNWTPCFSDDDAKFFETQYDVLRMV